MTYERIALKLGVSKKTIERDIALDARAVPVETGTLERGMTMGTT